MLEAMNLLIRPLSYGTGILIAAPLCGQSVPPQTPPKADYTLSAQVMAGNTYPGYQLVAYVSLSFDPQAPDKDSNGAPLVYHLANAIGNGWKCSDVQNYDVEAQVGAGPQRRVVLDRVEFPSGAPCQVSPPVTLPAAVVYFKERVDLNATYSVTITVDGKTASASGLTFTANPPAQGTQPTGPAVFSFNPQSVLNEPLSDGTYKGVEQFGLAYANPNLGDKGFLEHTYINSNNLFSTNERDTNSSFDFAVGLRQGLTRKWYFPASIEGSAQGNQVATNLSAVVTGAIGSEFPWRWAVHGLNNSYIAIPYSPELNLAATYTHRVNQVVQTGTTPLATDDFAVVPSMAFAHNSILPKVCKWYQAYLIGKGAPKPAAGTNQFCLNFEADFGLYYLPRDLTPNGSQRVEGYGDFSFLVPLTDFQLPFVPQALNKQTLTSQFRIKYADAVSAANNYARTKKWSFGVEVIK